MAMAPMVQRNSTEIAAITTMVAILDEVRDGVIFTVDCSESEWSAVDREDVVSMNRVSEMVDVVATTKGDGIGRGVGDDDGI